MSTESYDRVLQGVGDQLSQALIARCRLSTEDVEQIANVMRRMHLSFADAALHLGLVAQEDVEDAMTSMPDAGGMRRDGLGIIEAVVKRQSATRSLTVLPRVTVKASPQLIIAHAADHPRSEGIRALRTEILLRNEPGLRSNMVVVLSPSAGEGRSQLAAELAIALAQIGRRTLLVDADLRRPSQHKLFNADNSWGLAQALAVGGSPQVLGVEGLPHLSVLPSGPGAPNPSELLASKHAERLVRLWGHDFEFVVVDTPPIDEFSDGLILATLIGRVLVVSRSHVSTHRSMKDMLRRLVSTRCRILGSVLSRF
jgi:protein-tyrosine kinase